ncbi:hypothetical protein PRIPAC_84523 [Pristionchus pacificus]|uniref:Uncharacterized protein n=1 Tax=Pristionchus pacificus TaxID=54126 RepID=A0A2A6D1I8_PRIPA|nr:hypothetical protein PRIPAC_84523 [Pristionchus pacificus]|eukprot:PDM84167.1 hypothetical protein PRIPAC_35143 [Pristionchus pacificus]
MMISEYEVVCKTANQMDDHDLAEIDNLNTEDIERVVGELGLDPIPVHKMDNLQSFLEASNHNAPSEIRSINGPSAPRRQLHSMYVMDENEEHKSEYELNKFDPIVFEKTGEIKSEYIGWNEPKNTEQLVTAGNEISIEELKEESSTVTAPILPSQHSIDNISDFKPAEGVLDPYMQVNRERLFNLLVAYQNQSGNVWNETVTGLGI